MSVQDSAGPVVVNPPSRIISGRSNLGNGGLRIPTVFSPEYAGYTFQMVGVDFPPGAILEMRNMTVVLPGVAFKDLDASPLFDYFTIGNAGRVCFMNRWVSRSALILKYAAQCNAMSANNQTVKVCYDT